MNLCDIVAFANKKFMTTAEPTKLFSLRFEHRTGYLYAYVSGEHDSYEISRQYWQEIADLLKTTEYARLLVEEDIIENSSMSEVFQLGSEMAGMGFGGIKIAFFDRHIGHSDINDFGALVGSNRGLHALAFDDFEKAETWLLADGK